MTTILILGPIAEIVRQAMSDETHRVMIVEVSEGQDALDLLRQVEVRLLIAGAGSAGMPIDDLLVTLAREGRLPDQVVVDPGRTSTARKLTLTRLGVSGFLRRPLQPDGLRQDLAGFLSIPEALTADLADLLDAAVVEALAPWRPTAMAGPAGTLDASEAFAWATLEFEGSWEGTLTVLAPRGWCEARLAEGTDGTDSVAVAEALAEEIGAALVPSLEQGGHIEIEVHPPQVEIRDEGSLRMHRAYHLDDTACIGVRWFLRPTNASLGAPR